MYTLRPPAPDLARYVEHHWFVHDAEGPVRLTVDAYVDARADLVVNLGAPYQREVIGGPSATLARSNLDAQRLVPIRIRQEGRVRTTGVRFHLGGVGAFCRGELRRFTGRTPSLTEVFGEDGDALETALARASGPDAQARVLDAWLLDRLVVDAGRRAFEEALAELVAGASQVGSVGDAVGRSARTVERLFARHLGVPPKTLVRVLRFQRALRALMRDPGVPLADVALEAGYFDQAHFVRDFRRMTGGVPRGYRGYFPAQGPHDFAPNVVAFVQDGRGRAG